LLKYKFFEQGISPEEFRKCQMRDVRDIMDIKNEIEIRAQRNAKVREMISRMK